jgi:DNA-nicking Smr family endonuclease
MNPRRYKRPPRTIPGSTEDILSFLDAYGVQDKDVHSARQDKRGSASKMPVDKGNRGERRMTLDLHGQTSDQAARSIRSAVYSCRDHGIRELLVIHGHGVHSAPEDGPVLKNLFHNMLENELALHVRDFRSGLPREGGEGVTLVWLK